MDFLAISALVVGLGAAFVGFWSGLKAFAFSARLDGLEARFQRMHNEAAGLAGNAAREAKSDRRDAAIAEGLAIWQGEGSEDEKKKKLVALGLKYPDVAGGVLKRVLQGKLPI